MMSCQTVYVIRDRLSGQISPLFLAPNVDTAERQFGMFLSGQSVPAKDYDLYSVGELSLFSDSPPILEPFATIHVCNGASIEQPNQEAT